MIAIDNENISSIVIKNCLIPTDSLHFGYEFMNYLTDPSVKLDDGQVRYIKERCKQFVLELIIQCQQRLPDNINTLLMLSEFLQLILQNKTRTICQSYCFTSSILLKTKTPLKMSGQDFPVSISRKKRRKIL